MSFESPAQKSLRFSWVIDRDLAASARPGRYGDIDEHLGYLKEAGIKTIINLCEDALDLSDGYKDAFEVFHVPVIDGDIPSDEQMMEVFAVVEKALGGNGPCLVHCRGGVGRTATVLAPVLMKFNGLELGEALEFLKESGRRTQSMEQFNFLKEWESALKGDA